MLEAICKAERTVNLETYIYWSGDIGRKFAEALSERAREGIAVHLVIDWAGSIKMDDDLLSMMKDAGVRNEHYRPLRWYNIGRLKNRTHRKLLVVDGRIGFTGGVGIADQWTGRAQDPEHWRDTHFRVEGPVVAQMQAAFNDNWIKSTGEVLNGPDYFPPLSPTGNMDAHLFIASPRGGSESMHLMYLMAITAAVKTIDIASAYFVPDAMARIALKAALARGVRVRVITPGKHTDQKAVRRASRAVWGELLEAGAELYEYRHTMYHCKMMMVDGLMSSVGSTNFDPRSFHLNDEANLNVYDREFTARLTEVFEDDIKRSKRITLEDWQNRPAMEKAREKLTSLMAPML
jgi:cardiolipin synthase